MHDRANFDTMTSVSIKFVLFYVHSIIMHKSNVSG